MSPGEPPSTPAAPSGGEPRGDSSIPPVSQRDRALAALQRMAKPKPRPAEEAEGGAAAAETTPHAQASEPDGSQGEGSATGFVGMLARRQLESDVRTPGEAEGPRRHAPLPMAREITPPDGIEVDGEPHDPAAPSLRDAVKEAATTAPARGRPFQAPNWYYAALPVMLTLAALLLAIGGWAIGAWVYMSRITPASPEDVHYPLLAWSYDAGEMGGYTAGSRLMAVMMLLCLPVALLLLMMAAVLRGRIKRSTKGRAATKNESPALSQPALEQPPNPDAG